MFFVPQLPVKGRYTKWWMNEFIKEFKERFDEVIILGPDLISDFETDRENFDFFTNRNNSLLLEIAQIEDYLDIKETLNDVLFFADLSYPGLFANVLFSKPFIGRKFAYCHATSKNKLDIFSDVRKSKFKVETGTSMIFNRVFVGSHYHKEKLGWSNTEVVRLPPPPESIIYHYNSDKYINISSVSRVTPQKVNKKLEKKIEKQIGCEINRQTFTDHDEYSLFLSRSKVLFISSKEDTFNYTIMDAIRCGCVPVAPNKLCFPEILPPEYLYNDYIEASQIIRKVLIGELGVPEMICKDEVDNFFNNICSFM